MAVYRLLTKLRICQFRKQTYSDPDGLANWRNIITIDPATAPNVIMHAYVVSKGHKFFCGYLCGYLEFKKLRNTAIAMAVGDD